MGDVYYIDLRTSVTTDHHMAKVGNREYDITIHTPPAIEGGKWRKMLREGEYPSWVLVIDSDQLPIEFLKGFLDKFIYSCKAAEK